MIEDLLLTIYDKKGGNTKTKHNSSVDIKNEEQNIIENNLVKTLRTDIPEDAYNFIADNIDLRNNSNILLTTKEKAYVESIDFDNLKVIINTKKLNILKNINTHLSSVNTLLPDAGIYIGRAETYDLRKIKFLKKFGEKIGFIVWIGDFIINRVIPKIKLLDKCYCYFTKSRLHTLSLAELLGRLVYNGFDIIDFKRIGDYTYFTTIKTKAPSTYSSPTYHPIVKLQRIGKNGKLVGIYKMRTMHPYSEYIQDFVVKLHGYNKYGKPDKDFRLTRWGKFLRKYWIDEIPQLINLFKGDLAIVGVRPLSKARYYELPLDIQTERIKHKPGLIPPYVSLNRPDDKGNIETERIFINQLKKHILTTKIKFFFMALYNIITGKIRSA